MNCCNTCATNANCNIPPISTGVKGCMLDETKATIVTVSMTNASSTSSAMDNGGRSNNKGNNKKSLPERKDKGFKP